MWRDVRTALRNLVRRPGFALAVILTLSFGIGANSAVFTVVDAVLLEDLPFENPDRLVAVEAYRLEEGLLEEWRHAHLNLVDLAEATEGLEEMASFSERHSLRLSVGNATEHLWGEFVSMGYFELLGMQPFLGRTFTEEEAAPPRGRNVAVISHDLWKRHYEGQRTLQERSIRLIDDVFVVIGVAPPEFQGFGDQADIWLPVPAAATLLGPHFIDFRGSHWLLAAGRLQEGVSLDQAQASIDAAMAHQVQVYPKLNEGLSVRLEPLQEAWFGDLRLALWSLLGGAGFVLLIACTNVSNLLMARTLERQRELAVRTALGAARGRLIRQILTESVALALVGGAGGLVLAHWTTDALIAFGAIDIPQFINAGTDLTVIGVMTLVSTLCGVGFGLVPALASSRFELAAALKEGGQTAFGSKRRALQSGLIVGEVVLAFVLLAGAAHTLQNFDRQRSRDLGFRSDNLVTLRLDLSGKNYATRDAKRRVSQLLVEGLEPIPEVESVAVVGPNLPIDGLVGSHYSIEYNPTPLILQFHFVSLSYFDMLGIALVDDDRDRTFVATDSAGSLPVCVVSEKVAQRAWPNENPVGKRLKRGRDAAESQAPWYTVVGVVRETVQSGFGDDQDYPDVYFHIQQQPLVQDMKVNVLLRTQRPADGDLLALLRSEIQGLVPDLPAYDVLTIEQRLSEQITNDRFLVFLMSLFTGLALVLTAVGIYGLLSYTVVQKSRDFGIRLALGSRRRALFRDVLRQAAVLTLVGIAAGVVLTVALRLVLASRVHEVIGMNPLILSGISMLLLVLAVGSSLVPAWRATRIDPNSVLREE